MLGLQMCTTMPQALTEPGTPQFRQTSSPANPSDPDVSASSALGFQACSALLSFSTQVLGLNLGP